MSKDNSANKIDRGVVHNWDVITKLIIDHTPYGIFIKTKEKCDEKHFKKRLPLELRREKVLTSKEIYEELLGKHENDKAHRILGRLNDDDKKYIRSYWDKRYYFVETCTRINLMLAILFSSLMFYVIKKSWVYAIWLMTIVGMIRVIEILTIQIRTILFDTVGKTPITLRSARRSIILLIYNVVEMIFWFTNSIEAAYLLAPVDYVPIRLCKEYSYHQFVVSSTLHFLVYGDDCTLFGQNVPKNAALMNITFTEILVGFIVTMFAFVRFFSLLPNVSVQDESSVEK